CLHLTRYIFFLLFCDLNVPLFFFFFNDTATPEIYTLSLHDALPIYVDVQAVAARGLGPPGRAELAEDLLHDAGDPAYRAELTLRSEEHTSELQSLTNLVCRLLLEKKNNNISLTSTIRDATTTITRQL